MYKMSIILAVFLVLAFVVRDTSPGFIADFRAMIKQYVGDYEEVGDAYKNYHKPKKSHSSPVYSSSKITI